MYKVGWNHNVGMVLNTSKYCLHNSKATYTEAPMLISYRDVGFYQMICTDTHFELMVWKKT